MSFHSCTGLYGGLSSFTHQSEKKGSIWYCYLNFS